MLKPIRAERTSLLIYLRYSFVEFFAEIVLGLIWASLIDEGLSPQQRVASLSYRINIVAVISSVVFWYVSNAAFASDFSIRTIPGDAPASVALLFVA